MALRSPMSDPLPRRPLAAWWWLLVLMGVVLAAVSCRAPAPTPTPTPIPTIATTPEPTATVPAPSGGLLRVAAVSAAFQRDLHQVVSEWGTLFGPGPAYSRLLRFKSGPEVQLPSMAVECDLCESWRVLDPLTYEFRLHPDARWQNVDPFPGRPVTAQDVVFSLERLRTVGWPHASLLAAVKEVTALDDRTIIIQLRYPDPDLPQNLANPHAVIVAPEVVQEGDFRQGPVVGSGPWLWQQGYGGQTDLTAFTEYHRPGFPRAGSVRFIPAADLVASSLVLGLNKVDVAQVSEEEWPRLAAKGFQSRLVPRQGNGLVLVVNAGSPPMDSLEVRRALFMALDPQAAVDQAWLGLGNVGVGVPVVEPDWLLSDEQVKGYFAQPAEAAGLLGGAPIAIRLTVANFGPRYVEHGQLIAEQLREAGFQVTVETLSRTQYLNVVWQQKEFQVSLGPLPPAATTNAFLLPLLHSRGQWHITNHQDPALDRLIEQQSSEMDAVRRGELVRQIQARVLDQALLFMPLITVERWGYSPRVVDFYPNMEGGDGSFWQAVGLAPAEKKR